MPVLVEDDSDDEQLPVMPAVGHVRPAKRSRQMVYKICTQKHESEVSGTNEQAKLHTILSPTRAQMLLKQFY